MPQLLRTAPIGATVISAEQIARSGVADANEAVRKLAGVPSRGDLSNGREPKLDLRGHGESSAQNLVVLVDGLRISENELVSARLSAIPLELIDRIEVLRGGASVLWGEGASAGVINVVLKHPDGELRRATVKTSFSAPDGQEFGFSGQVGAGPWALDAALRQVREGGWRDNADHTQGVGSLGVQFREAGWRASWRVHQEDLNSRLPGYLSFEDFRQRPRTTDTPNDSADSRELRHTVQLGWSGGGWDLQVDAGQRERDASSRFGDEVRSTSRQTQLTPRVSHSGELAGVGYTALAGLDFQHWRYDRTGDLGLETGAQRNRAFFVHGDASLPTDTRLSTGWRVERVTKVGNFPGSVNPFPQAAAVYERPDKLFANEFGIGQTLWPGWEAYARAASSYRLANVDENRLTPGQGPLLPQRNRDRELGLKWAQGAHSATLRAFVQHTRDEILYVAQENANANIDPVRRRGVEAEGRWQVLERLSLSFAAQQITARYQEGVNAGKEMVLVSPRSAMLRATWQVDDRQTLEVGLQHHAASRFSGDEANTCSVRVPSSTLLDARYAWADADWTVAVSGTNLTDRRGFDYGFAFDNGQPCGLRYVYPYAGRGLRFSLTRRF
jgi:iron complex outermembrane receptor protein